MEKKKKKFCPTKWKEKRRVLRNGGAGILPDKYVFLTDEYQWSVQSQKLFLESCNITTTKFPYAYHLR